MDFFEKWNSVNEALPANDGKYIVAIKLKGGVTDIKTVYFNVAIQQFIVKDLEKVTHWKPLPKLPTI